MLSLVAGLAGGAIHALSGPDHLAAVAPLSLGDRWRGLRAGFEWGVGHGVGVALLGLVAVVAHQLVPIEELSSWCEALVGYVLIGLGAWALWRARGFARDSGTEPREEALRHHSPATLGLGVLHGSAGASHLAVVLPAAGLSLANAVGFLVFYVVGATAAMVVVGGAAGELSARGGRRYLPVLLGAAGLVAIVVGAFWVVAAHAA
jgi:hypothetical protein